MTLEKLSKKYNIRKDSLKDDLLDMLENVCSLELDSCCGLTEIKISGNLRDLEYKLCDVDLKLTEEFLFDILSFLLEDRKVASLILSDVKENFTKINKLLSKIVPPIICGINPNSGKHIYLWVVSLNALRNYKKQKLLLSKKK